MDILNLNENAYGVGDSSQPKANPRNGPNLVNAASVAAGGSSAMVKHNPATFKGNTPGQNNSIVPSGGLTFKQMIENPALGCNAHQSLDHSTKDCRAASLTELTASRHHQNTLVRKDTGKPVYFRREKDSSKVDTQKANNPKGGKRQGSDKDSNPTPAKDAKLDNAGTGGGKGKNGGGRRGNKGGKPQANSANIADCHHCVNARKAGGTAAVPDSESLKHSPSDCPRQAAAFAQTITNNVTSSITSAFEPILKRLGVTIPP